MTDKNLGRRISELKKEIAKLEAIRVRYPDATYVKRRRSFKSKQANSDFDDVLFTVNRWGLWCSTVSKINYLFEGKEYTELVYSFPIENCLIHRRQDFLSKKSKIWFSRFAVNLKNHNFPEHLIEKSRKEMLKFISDDPSIIIDMKHIDPKIKKFLSFV